MASFPRSIENCDFSPKSKGETLIKTSKVADFLGKLLKATEMKKKTSMEQKDLSSFITISVH